MKCIPGNFIHGAC